jgi:uncharacterized cupin superfamily protein
VRERKRWKLGDAVGLDQFGVSLLRLAPASWSSQRHWHTAEDEFVWVVQGEVVLVEDDGETVLRAGDCAGFKAGVPNGHQIQNRSTPRRCCWRSARGRRTRPTRLSGPRHDRRPDDVYRHRDGTPYDTTKGRKR